MDKLSLQANPIPYTHDGQFIIITPTCGDGDCPEVVLDYLSQHAGNCIGSIIGGNRNFGASFGGAGNVIKQRFGIPCLYKFELAGTEVDVMKCKEGIQNWLQFMSGRNRNALHAMP